MATVARRFDGPKMTLIPEVLWAQRSSETEPEKNVIFLDILVQDVKNPKIDLTSTSFKFESGSDDDDRQYAVTINFFDEIDVEKSHHTTTGRGLFYVLRKKEAKKEYWPRLTKEKKLPYIKTDFDKWVDEDEQDEQTEDPAMNFGDGLDLSQLTGGGAGGGMPDLSQLAGGAGGGMPDLSALQGMQGMGGGMPADESSGDEEEEDVKEAK
uniref:ARAD1C12254p n=1 Tax=Blastobotrys adeninivorans TaxID=409370 RepID=A0A060T5H5_BLAAD